MASTIVEPGVETQPKQRKRLAIFTGVNLIVLMFLSGDVFLGSQKMTTKDWCTTVQSKLRGAGIGWPVANQILEVSQIESIIDIFSVYAPRSVGTLEIASQGWLQGFIPMSEYLLVGDRRSYENNVSQGLQDQLFLANVAINNLCGWVTWK